MRRGARLNAGTSVREKTSSSTANLNPKVVNRGWLAIALARGSIARPPYKTPSVRDVPMRSATRLGRLASKVTSSLMVARDTSAHPMLRLMRSGIAPLITWWINLSAQTCSAIESMQTVVRCGKACVIRAARSSSTALTIDLSRLSTRIDG